ncbi:MAG: DUF6262 family protein [Marinilabiliales bacterium]|nr:DUF6262 family protein [Marinilabiliales bacterium]
MAKQKQSKNTDGLKAYAEKKNQETIDRVNEAIDRLKRSSSRPINFKTVAEAAGVSKATLYNNDILKERILSLRAMKKGIRTQGVAAASNDQMQLQAEKIKQLYKEINNLREDKKKLIVQLVLMEELKDENQKLREQIKRLSSQKVTC